MLKVLSHRIWGLLLTKTSGAVSIDAASLSEGSFKSVNDEPDLEMPLSHTGSEWANASENVGEGESDLDLDVTLILTTTSEKEPSWSTVVKNGNRCVNLVSSNSASMESVSRGQHLQGGLHGLRDHCGPDFSGPELQHKSMIEPVFLAYNRVSNEGACLSLIQIATSVVDSLGDSGVVDAVQPMKTGW